jgi:hypothetical protein
MRNIDGSDYLKNPELEIVQTSRDKSVTGASFVLYADQTAAPDQDAKGAAKKPKKRVASAGG